VGKHIENVLVELPMHVSPEEATMNNETVELCHGTKETKRCFDYRCALIMVTNRVMVTNLSRSTEAVTDFG
jgi:hypothetical protein